MLIKEHAKLCSFVMEYVYVEIISCLKLQTVAVNIVRWWGS